MNPEKFTTLIEMLASQAETCPTQAAFTFNGTACTFAELWRRVNFFAENLQKLSLQKQECVLIALPNSAEFFFAFYGVQRAGGIAVPVFPHSGRDRLLSIAEACRARIIVVAENLTAQEMRQINEAAHGRGVTVVTVGEGSTEDSESSFPIVQPTDVAFIQFTSGSTGNPKGVMLTQANLLTNIRQMIAGMKITEREIFVSWLPVYHDMGLILKTMVPFYLGAETHLLPTELRDVRSWLEAIATHKATFTAAPDFAYRLVLNHVKQNEYDLTSLRVALNAAEPVRANTIREFENRFGLKNVMTAGYGLAEATVGVSMSPPGETSKVDARGIVSVGKPFPAVEVKIVDGEILVKSAANCKGYFKNPSESEKLFREGFILSGDLGYLDEAGNLYITGRKKNIIKHLGQTIAAQELEEIVDSIPAVRYSAAVGIDRGQLMGEQVYLFAVARNSGGQAAWEDLTIQIVEAVHDRLGIRPARVVFLKAHAIPRTDNGKIQHVLLKERFLSGSLKADGQILFPDY